MLVKKSTPAPVECVVRGYLAGSGWKEYQQTGRVCGIALPDGLVEAANAGAEFFGDTRFEQIVAAGASLDPGQLVDQLVAELRRWIGFGRDLQDDVTVVVVDVG